MEDHDLGKQALDIYIYISYHGDHILKSLETDTKTMRLDGEGCTLLWYRNMVLHSMFTQHIH